MQMKKLQAWFKGTRSTYLQTFHPNQSQQRRKYPATNRPHTKKVSAPTSPQSMRGKKEDQEAEDQRRREKEQREEERRKGEKGAEREKEQTKNRSSAQNFGTAKFKSS